MFIKMKIAGLTLDSSSNVPLLILKDEGEQHSVTICIGIVEASAIAFELQKVSVPRPMTHDLLKNVLDKLETKVEKVEVIDLRGSTFYAAIHLRVGNTAHVIDSRPSDAIALALRTGAPIYVEESVIEKLKVPDERGKPAFTGKETQRWTEFLDGLTREDFGKYKM